MISDTTNAPTAALFSRFVANFRNIPINVILRVSPPSSIRRVVNYSSLEMSTGFCLILGGMWVNINVHSLL